MFSIKKKIQGFVSAKVEEIIRRVDEDSKQSFLEIEKDISKVRDENRDLTSRLERQQSATMDSINSVFRNSHEVGDTIVIAFLISNYSSLYTIKSLINKMMLDSRFDVHVFSIQSRLRPDEGFHTEQKTHEVLVQEKIPHVRLPFDVPGLALLKKLNPDVIVRQSQWDNDVQEHFTTPYLNFTKLVLIDYAIAAIVDSPTVGSEYLHETTDSPLARMAWRVYRSSIIDDLRVLKEDFAPDMKNRREVGSPKVREIIEAKPLWFRNTTNLKVFWTSHHSITNDWISFGVFPNLYKQLLQFARIHPEIDIVFSEHPSLVSRIAEGRAGIDMSDFDAWLGEWNQLDNTYVLTGTPDYVRYMKKSDVVITDGLSPLVEAQLLTKPIVFIENDWHVPFNDFGKRIASGWHTVKVGENAVYEAFELANEINLIGDDLADAQKNNAQNWLKNIDSEDKIIADIGTLLQ